MSDMSDIHLEIQKRENLSNEYYEMNGSHVEVWETPPSALEFSRLVHISRPVIIKGYELPACALWTDHYLVDVMGEQTVSVAVTPNGRADAIARGPDSIQYFTEPMIEKMSMTNFLTGLAEMESADVYYLQSQNGNLFPAEYFAGDLNKSSELKSLRQDITSSIPWCNDALGKLPDAVNIWIGNSRSITSIHCDPYENIYAVIRGTKHFTLLSPTDGWSLQEKSYPHATYTRQGDHSTLRVTPSTDGVPPIRWPSIDNLHLTNALPPSVHPIGITLHPGEMLYLPVGWWHQVRQSDDTTIAVNWWYDAEMRGMSWVMLNFLRNSI